MRGSMFVATAWGRHPLRPYTPVRMGQNVVCTGDVCKVEPPAAEPSIPVAPAPSTTPPTESSGFPIVPVAIGAGALILVAAIL